MSTELNIPVSWEPVFCKWEENPWFYRVESVDTGQACAEVIYDPERHVGDRFRVLMDTRSSMSLEEFRGVVAQLNMLMYKTYQMNDPVSE